MAEVDTSIYRNQPNPLAGAQGVFNLLNTARQNELLGIATRQRQFDLNQAQTNAVISGIAPLAARDDITKPVALGNVAAIIKSLNIPPQISGPILDQVRNTPDNPKALKATLGNLFAIMQGTGAGQPVTGAVQPGSLAPTQTTAAARATQGTLPVAPGPAATAAAGTAGTAAGTLLGGEAVAQSDYRNRVTPLEVAIPALERLGTTGTGPGKTEINQMKSIAVSFGFAPEKWTGTVKDFDEAQKYLVQQARTLGNTGTNDQLAAAFSGNPNMKMSNAAAVDVAKTMLALQRQKYMQLQEFYASGQPPENFGRWASQWNARHDPRAFGFDHLSVDQRKQIIKSLPPAKRAQFMLDVDAADKAGVLTNQ